MRQSGKCPKCESRRLLIINEVNQDHEICPRPLSVVVSTYPAHMRQGKFQMVVCCRCGFTEWYAHAMDEVMSGLGKLFPGVRVVDGDFSDAVESLGLVRDEAAESRGWKSFAQGAYQGVPIAIGERVREQVTDRRTRKVMRIEIMPKTRSDLGTYAFCRPFTDGHDAHFRTLRRVLTGETTIDRDFITTVPCPRETWSSEVFDVQIPWLDETVRTHLRATPLVDEVAVVGSDVSILLDEYEPAAFRSAIDLALHLARWTPPTSQPYR